MLRDAGILVFGPSRAAAMLEASKAFTKEICDAVGAPTAAVKPEDAPKSALDFLKPMFAGKLITCYPADDDATLYLFHIIVQKYGWDWMTKYTANKPNYVQGHLPVARSVVG